MHTVATTPPARAAVPQQGPKWRSWLTPSTTDLIVEYLTHLEDLGRSENTIDHYAELLIRMDKQLDDGLPYSHSDELRDWINSGGRQNITRAHYRAIINGFFAWAIDPRDPKIDFNPVGLLAQPKVRRRQPRPVTTEQVFGILSRAEQPYRLWFLIAAYAGLRCTELAGLERSHITRDDMWVRGKGDVERIVPTHPLIWDEVHEMSGRIIRRRDGGPASRRYVSGRGNHQLHYVLGLEGVTMHRLRRWFGTASYYAADKDILVVKELLGHASVTTSQIYIDTARADMTHAVASLPVAS